MSQVSDSNRCEFTIRTFQFRELAILYFPTSTPETASKAFRRMINACKGLPELMAEKGFVAGGKTLSPALVGVIIAHLGEP